MVPGDGRAPAASGERLSVGGLGAAPGFAAAGGCWTGDAAAGVGKTSGVGPAPGPGNPLSRPVSARRPATIDWNQMATAALSNTISPAQTAAAVTRARLSYPPRTHIAASTKAPNGPHRSS